MSLFQSIKSFFSRRSYHQSYAHQNGFRLVEVKGIGWDLYNGQELVDKFPYELAASKYIYQLNIEALANNNDKN